DAAAWTDGTAHLPPRLGSRARRRGRLPGRFRPAGPQGGTTAERSGRTAIAGWLVTPRRLSNSRERPLPISPPPGPRTTGPCHESSRSRPCPRGYMERGPPHHRRRVGRAARRSASAADRLLFAGQDARGSSSGAGAATGFGGLASGESAGIVGRET